MSSEEAVVGGEASVDAMTARQAFLDNEAEWLQVQIHVDHPERYGIPTVRLTGANRGTVVGSWGGDLREYVVENVPFIHHTGTPSDAADLFADGERLWQVTSQTAPGEDLSVSPRLRCARIALEVTDAPARVQTVEDNWYFGARRVLHEERESIAMVRGQYRRILALRDAYGDDLASLYQDLRARFDPNGNLSLGAAIDHTVERVHNDMEALRLDDVGQAWIRARLAGSTAVGEATAA
ncbi:MAG: hypothetical protein ABWY71_00985 [Candidatus Saccharimonadales bacterium]